MIIAVAWTFTFLALLLLGEWRHDRVLIWIGKPLASLGFVAVAIALGAAHTSYGRVVLGALALCLVGDVLLIPQASRRSFLAGLVSFLLGHLVYGVAFWVHGLRLTVAGVGLLGLVVVGLVVGGWLLPKVPDPMKVPVGAYVVVISLMVALSVGVAGAGGTALIPLGAVLFYLSDLTVARDRFVTGAFMNRAIGLPLYYGAQVALALSVMR